MTPKDGQIKVLIVDDSAVVRQVMSQVLAKDPQIVVIGVAADPIIAQEKMAQEWPDVIVLDVEMPRMDGITFLRQLMSRHPVPVVICSTLTEKGAETTMQALAAGAICYITKPKLGLKDFISESAAELIRNVKLAAQARPRVLAAYPQASQAPGHTHASPGLHTTHGAHGAQASPLPHASHAPHIGMQPLPGNYAGGAGSRNLHGNGLHGQGAAHETHAPSAPHQSHAAHAAHHPAAGFDNPVHAPFALSKTTEKVIAIGTSTGGTQALEVVLMALPAAAPGVVIVQHMPEKFTAMFAARLNGLCQIEVKEARHGDRVMPGRALIAPGGLHMRLVRNGAYYQVDVIDGPPVNRHKPSVDVLFKSVAHVAGANALGIIMTGMGDDGARGLREMHDAGARTIAQDEASCVVFGMPKEAIKLNAVDHELPLDQIAAEIVRFAK